MESNKKHIQSSFKNEQETINEIEAIKFEKANPLSTSESGYNVKFNRLDEFASDAHSPDSSEPAVSAQSSQEPDSLANNSMNFERPLPERIINNRIK